MRRSRSLDSPPQPRVDSVRARFGRSIRNVARQRGERPRTVAYVVFNEHLWNPLLRGQVVELVKRLPIRLEVHRFYLLVFVPASDATAHRKRYDDLRAELATVGVTLVVRTWPTRLPKVVGPLLVAGRVGVSIASMRFRKNVAVFHVRSYPGAAAVATAARIVGGALIFDPRSPFPEENVASGRWTEDSRAFAFWKRAECRLLRQAAVTVAIAPMHERQLLKTEPASRTVVIPNNVDVERFAVSSSERCDTRRALNVGENETLLCYLGSLNGAWNKPENYACFLQRLSGWSRRHRLLLVVPKGDHPFVRATFTTAGLDEGRDYVLVHATPSEAPLWLAGADLGLQLFASPDVRVGVKVVEYLAAGLPVVTNRNVLGAAELVEEEGVGLVVVEGDQEALIEQLENLLARRVELRERCVALARSRFSTDRIADQYAAVYAEVLAHR